jgi:hypothetical protein
MDRRAMDRGADLAAVIADFSQQAILGAPAIYHTPMLADWAENVHITANRTHDGSSFSNVVVIQASADGQVRAS